MPIQVTRRRPDPLPHNQWSHRIEHIQGERQSTTLVHTDDGFMWGSTLLRAGNEGHATVITPPYISYYGVTHVIIVACLAAYILPSSTPYILDLFLYSLALSSIPLCVCASPTPFCCSWSCEMHVGNNEEMAFNYTEMMVLYDPSPLRRRCA